MMGCGMYMDSSTLDRVQLADVEPNRQSGRTLIALSATIVALVFAGAAVAATWHRVHVWTSHGISLTAKRYLTAGTYRLIYRARNQGTWIHVNLYCGSKHYGESHRVRRRPRTLVFSSTGCKLKVLMLGYGSADPSEMFMRLELDRRSG